MTRPRPTRRTRRPHGNLVFTNTQKTAYLKHVTRGLTLNEAATAIGVDRRTILHHTKSDPAFRQAREDAKAAGRSARWEGKPHDEYRYNHGGCRCLDCCTAARKARAARRAEPAPTATEEDPKPILLRLPTRPAHDAPSTLTA